MIPAWVGPYIGIPFAERGRTRQAIDCWGLIRLVYLEQFGVTLPSYELRYDTTRDRVAIARLFFEEVTSARWRRVELEAAHVPDALSFSLVGASHAGLLVAPDRFLHVLPGRETCVERFRPQWVNRVGGVYRHEAFIGAGVIA